MDDQGANEAAGEDRLAVLAQRLAVVPAVAPGSGAAEAPTVAGKSGAAGEEEGETSAAADGSVSTDLTPEPEPVGIDLTGLDPSDGGESSARKKRRSERRLQPRLHLLVCGAAGWASVFEDVSMPSNLPSPVAYACWHMPAGTSAVIKPSHLASSAVIFCHQL